MALEPTTRENPGLFSYGRREPISLADESRSPATRKYLAFDADLGGFNNILMNFEIMVVLASLTGRTLVLPPPRPFYLLGDAPRLLLDFFDRACLEASVDVMSAEDFLTERGWSQDLVASDRYHAHLREQGLNPGWHSVEDALLHPAGALTQRFELIPRLLRRRAVAITDQIRYCDLLYFPSTAEHRLLGPFETFFLFADERKERRARALVRDAVRYHPAILALAERAVREGPLATENFAAIHIRRGDFQYEETRIEIESIMEHSKSALEPGQAVYVATDERTAAFLQPLRDVYRVTTLADLTSIAAETPPEWAGIVETLICAAAPGRFIGTRLSTFSARISTLRGYLSSTPGSPREGIDMTLYYTQPPLTSRGSLDALAETQQPWWESVGDTPLWGRAYPPVWMDTE